jgi:hypothetical protein
MPLYKNLDDIEDIAINFYDASILAAMELINIEPELAKEIMVCSEKFIKIARAKMKEAA